MSNIIINANESQNENQKTTPVKESFSEPNSSNTNLLDSLFLTWLGIVDTFQESTSLFNILAVQ